jgi:HEAT repeat protein
MEELVIQHNEEQYTSDQYRASLSSAAQRAEVMASDLPPEMDEWLESIGQDNIRRLSVILMVDLLRMEQREPQAASLVEEMGAIAEDLILAGDYGAALEVASVLSRHATTAGALAHEAARRMLLDLARSTAVREAISALDAMDENQFEAFRRLCPPLGGATIETLHKRLLTEEEGVAAHRSLEIIGGFGADAVAWLAPLVEAQVPAARRNLADLLGRIACPEAVPLLEPLLASDDPKVVTNAVRALGRIDDRMAARALHAGLRRTTGSQHRAIVQALIEIRERRVAPILGQILDESRPFHEDHELVLEALEALSVVGDDRAVPAITRMMQRKRWFAARKVRALKEASVRALVGMRSPKAEEALLEAGQRGDRVLRPIARAALGVAS